MENKFNLQIILDEKILKIDNIIIDLANIHSLSFLKKESINGKQHYCYNQLIYLSDMVDLKVFLKTENMIHILFQTPEFFEKNLLHSKVLKRFMKKYKLEHSNFYVEHPTKVILNKENHKWNLVEFTYDPKQGDISMSLEF